MQLGLLVVRYEGDTLQCRDNYEIVKFILTFNNIIIMIITNY